MSGLHDFEAALAAKHKPNWIANVCDSCEGVQVWPCEPALAWGELSDARSINADLLEALKATAGALHETGKKMGCYTAGSFEECDTSLCVQARATIKKATKS